MINSLPEGLSLRNAKPTDSPFLERVHKESREDLLLINGERDFIEDIIEMQFRAQNLGYGDNFPNAMYFIVEKHHEPIGKLTIDFGHNEVAIIDVAFIKAARNKGFGEGVIRAVQAVAEKSKAPVTLSVLEMNTRAQQLYLRLGFRPREIYSPHIRMEWLPTSLTVAVGNPLGK